MDEVEAGSFDFDAGARRAYETMAAPLPTVHVQVRERLRGVSSLTVMDDALLSAFRSRVVHVVHEVGELRGRVVGSLPANVAPISMAYLPCNRSCPDGSRFEDHFTFTGACPVPHASV